MTTNKNETVSAAQYGMAKAEKAYKEANMYSKAAKAYKETNKSETVSAAQVKIWATMTPEERATRCKAMADGRAAARARKAREAGKNLTAKEVSLMVDLTKRTEALLVDAGGRETLIGIVDMVMGIQKVSTRTKKTK